MVNYKKLGKLLIWRCKQKKVGSQLPTATMAEIEETEPAPSILLPCTSCSRTFRPEALAKHSKVCEKVLMKKRKQFDSSKQRLQGTEIESFVIPSVTKTPRKREPQLNLSKSKWKEKVELARTMQAAKKSIDSSLSAHIKPSEHEECPHCGRTFGPKAFERHTEFCKEQQQKLKLANNVNNSEAKERLKVRTTYRGPLTYKVLNRDRYQPNKNRDPSPLGLKCSESFDEVNKSRGLSRHNSLRSSLRSKPEMTPPPPLRRTATQINPSTRGSRGSTKDFSETDLLQKTPTTNNKPRMISKEPIEKRMKPTNSKTVPHLSGVPASSKQKPLLKLNNIDVNTFKELSVINCLKHEPPLVENQYFKPINNHQPSNEPWESLIPRPTFNPAKVQNKDILSAKTTTQLGYKSSKAQVKRDINTGPIEKQAESSTRCIKNQAFTMEFEPDNRFLVYKHYKAGLSKSPVIFKKRISDCFETVKSPGDRQVETEEVVEDSFPMSSSKETQTRKQIPKTQSDTQVLNSSNSYPLSWRERVLEMTEENESPCFSTHVHNLEPQTNLQWERNRSLLVENLSDSRTIPKSQTVESKFEINSKNVKAEIFDRYSDIDHSSGTDHLFIEQELSDIFSADNDHKNIVRIPSIKTVQQAVLSNSPDYSIPNPKCQSIIDPFQNTEFLELRHTQINEQGTLQSNNYLDACSYFIKENDYTKTVLKEEIDNVANFIPNPSRQNISDPYEDAECPRLTHTQINEQEALQSNDFLYAGVYFTEENDITKKVLKEELENISNEYEKKEALKSTNLVTHVTQVQDYCGTSNIELSCNFIDLEEHMRSPIKEELKETISNNLAETGGRTSPWNLLSDFCKDNKPIILEEGKINKLDKLPSNNSKSPKMVSDISLYCEYQLDLFSRNQDDDSGFPPELFEKPNIHKESVIAFAPVNAISLFQESGVLRSIDVGNEDEAQYNNNKNSFQNEGFHLSSLPIHMDLQQNLVKNYNKNCYIEEKKDVADSINEEEEKCGIDNFSEEKEMFYIDTITMEEKIHAVTSINKEEKCVINSIIIEEKKCDVVNINTVEEKHDVDSISNGDNYVIGSFNQIEENHFVDKISNEENYIINSFNKVAEKHVIDSVNTEEENDVFDSIYKEEELNGVFDSFDQVESKHVLDSVNTEEENNVIDSSNQVKEKHVLDSVYEEQEENDVFDSVYKEQEVNDVFDSFDQVESKHVVDSVNTEQENNVIDSSNQVKEKHVLDSVYKEQEVNDVFDSFDQVESKHVVDSVNTEEENDVIYSSNQVKEKHVLDSAYKEQEENYVIDSSNQVKEKHVVYSVNKDEKYVFGKMNKEEKNSVIDSITKEDNTLCRAVVESESLIEDFSNEVKDKILKLAGQEFVSMANERHEIYNSQRDFEKYRVKCDSDTSYKSSTKTDCLLRDDRYNNTYKPYTYCQNAHVNSSQEADENYSDFFSHLKTYPQKVGKMTMGEELSHSSNLSTNGDSLAEADPLSPRSEEYEYGNDFYKFFQSCRGSKRRSPCATERHRDCHNGCSSTFPIISSDFSFEIPNYSNGKSKSSEDETPASSQQSFSSNYSTPIKSETSASNSQVDPLNRTDYVPLRRPKYHKNSKSCTLPPINKNNHKIETQSRPVKSEKTGNEEESSNFFLHYVQSKNNYNSSIIKDFDEESITDSNWDLTDSDTFEEQTSTVFSRSSKTVYNNYYEQVKYTQDSNEFKTVKTSVYQLPFSNPEHFNEDEEEIKLPDIKSKRFLQCTFTTASKIPLDSTTAKKKRKSNREKLPPLRNFGDCKWCFPHVVRHVITTVLPKRFSIQDAEKYNPYLSAERQMLELFGTDESKGKHTLPEINNRSSPIQSSQTSAFVKYASPKRASSVESLKYDNKENNNADMEIIDFPPVNQKMDNRKNFSLSSLSLCSIVSIDSIDCNKNSFNSKLCDDHLDDLQRTFTVVESKSNRSYSKPKVNLQQMLYGPQSPEKTDQTARSESSNSDIGNLEACEAELLISMLEFEKMLKSSPSPLSSHETSPNLCSSSVQKRQDDEQNAENRNQKNLNNSIDSAYSSLTRSSGADAETGKLELSKFCHECGVKYPIALAKFCCNCGMRRISL